MWWIFVVLFLILFVYFEMVSWRARRPIILRGCAGLRWRRKFPDATQQDIREFLDLFVDAFGFSKKHRLRLRPDDKMMDLYRIVNPPECSVGDNMEVEMLTDYIQSSYEVDIVRQLHEEITLGDLFCLTQPKQID